MRVLVPLRQLIDYMEWHHLLSKEEPRQVHAFAVIAQPLAQHGLDLLRTAWNAHRVKPRSDCPGSGGVPNKRARVSGHPGGQLQLLAGVVQVYEATRGELVRRVPEYAVDADPLLASPQLRTQRGAAIAAIMGPDLGLAWMEIIGCNYARFLGAYLTFLC